MSEEERANRQENRNLAQLERAVAELRLKVGTELNSLSETVKGHGLELDRIDQSMPDDHSCRGANVPLTPFSGNRDEDFQQYIKRFELACAANNYAEDKRAQILASYLRDKAFYLYDSLPTAQKANYDALKATLGEKFQTADYCRYAHQKFQARKQSEHESVMDYGCALNKLGLAALPKVDAEQRDGLIREKFIAGLLPHLQELIVYSNPKSFNEALTFAERLESVQSSKVNATARHVMLLEGFSDRLSRLEVSGAQGSKGSARAQLDHGYQANAVQMDVRGGFQNRGPRGMVCYRCNQVGHMARNCRRGQDISQVICRNCNAPGHFARNCQRRVAIARARNNSGSRQWQSNGPPAGPTTRRTLGVVEEEGPSPPLDGADTEAATPWQPLVGALDKDSPAASSWKVVSKQKDSREQQTTSGRTIVLTERLVLRMLVLFLLVGCGWSRALASAARSTQKSGPMICQAGQARSLWKLPGSLSCPAGNHSLTDTIREQDFMIYKRNFIQYRSKAWKCVKVTEEARTFSYFFGDENLKRMKKYTEPVSAEECTIMKKFKRCGTDPMMLRGGVYGTDKPLRWHYPGGGMYCCRWKEFKTTNCFMYENFVYKRHGTSRMESAAGDVSDCNYKKGQCVLKDDSFLLWKVNRTSFCELLPWKQIKGKSFGTSWLSNDNNLALTFTKKQQITDCESQPLLLSDQGLAVKPVAEKSTRVAKREIARKDIVLLEKQEASGGLVSAAQLAASMEAMELKWRKSTSFAFSHALNGVCNFMKTVVEMLKTQVMANPTNAIRWLTNQSNIWARTGGNVVEIYPCEQLLRSQYAFTSMNQICTMQVPIEFTLQNVTHKGFLDPLNNIVHRFATPVDCSLVREVPLQINGVVYLYRSSDGSLRKAGKIPTIKALQWNVDPLVDMKATIFHEIVIYSWQELQTHISLNDIMGGLSQQQAILRNLGVQADEPNAEKAAGNVVSRIMDQGYFGFLRGLSRNAWQIWTFCICVYVTLCIIAVHCCPIAGIPLPLNLPRMVHTAWTARRQQSEVNNGQEEQQLPIATAPPLLRRWGGTRDVPLAERYVSPLTLERLPGRPLRALPAPTLKSFSVSEDYLAGEPMTMLRQYPSLPTGAQEQPFPIGVIGDRQDSMVRAYVNNRWVMDTRKPGQNFGPDAGSLASTLRNRRRKRGTAGSTVS